MPKTSTINTTDVMGSCIEFPKFDDFPEYDESLDSPKYQESPNYDASLHLPTSPEPKDFSESTAIMADISELPRSPISPANKLHEQVIRTPGRKPSPQPVHFSVPPRNGNGNGHRVLRSATVGYVAPEFKGKKAQMLQGKLFVR
jgi:hypothetical protein